MELDHEELDELRIRPSGNRPTDNLPVQALFGPHVKNPSMTYSSKAVHPQFTLLELDYEVFARNKTGMPAISFL